MSHMDELAHETRRRIAAKELMRRLHALEADNVQLRAVLDKIGEGHVPPGFLTGIETEGKASFQERLATWMQKTAKEALTTSLPDNAVGELVGAVQNVLNGLSQPDTYIETAQDETWANAWRRLRKALATFTGETK